MKKIDIFFKKYIKGDKYLWAFITLFSIFSFLPVYSSSNGGVPFFKEKEIIIQNILKHTIYTIIGFCILLLIQFINYKYFCNLSTLFIMFIISTLINVKNNILKQCYCLPIIVPFQISNFSSLPLFIYCVKYLTKKRKEMVTLISSVFPLLIPIFIVMSIIYFENKPIAVIIFFYISIILFIGGYPLINLIGLFLVGASLLVTYFFLEAKFCCNNNFGISRNFFSWKCQILENIFDNKKHINNNVYQSKKAIYLGNRFGRGPGKSITKNYLQNSSSEFIYPIIIEEYGLFVGIIVLFIYLLILFRIIIIATKINDFFCALLVISIGLPIIIQAFINISSTIGIVPLVKQNLPLIGVGDSSMLATFFSFGIILNVSRVIYEKYKP